MKATTTLFFLTITTFVVLTLAVTKKTKIRTLTTETVEDYLKDYGNLVIFFTNTKKECKNCEIMRKIFEQSVKDLQMIEKSTDVLPTYFSCDENPDHEKFCQNMSAQQTPAIILFRKGKAFRMYSHGNNPKTLTDWIITKTRPLVVPLNDKMDIQQYLLDAKDKKLIGYFRKGENGDKEYKMFRDLLFQDPLWSHFAPVGIVRDEKIADDEVNGAPGLQVYNPKTKKRISIHQDELAKSREFIIKNGYNLFSLVNEDLFEIYTNSGLHTMIVHYKNIQDVQASKLMFLEIASAKSGLMFWTYAPLNPQLVKRFEEMGVNTNNPVLINSYTRNSNYPHRPIYFKGNSKNKEEVVEWVDGILNGKILPSSDPKDEL